VTIRDDRNRTGAGNIIHATSTSWTQATWASFTQAMEELLLDSRGRACVAAVSTMETEGEQLII